MKKGREDEVMKTIRRTLLYVNRQKKTDRTLLSLTAFGPLCPLFSHEGKEGSEHTVELSISSTKNTIEATNAHATFVHEQLPFSYSFLNPSQISLSHSILHSRMSVCFPFLRSVLSCNLLNLLLLL